MNSLPQSLRTFGICVLFCLSIGLGVLTAEQRIARGAEAEPSIKSVKDLGPQFVGKNSAITGADGATSTALPTGESIWLFGDTVEQPFESIRTLDLTGLRSSTAALVPKQNASQGITQYRFLTANDGKRPRQILPFAATDDPAHNRLWAIHGAAIGMNVYLFYHRITMIKGVDVFTDFKLDGMGIAKAELGKFNFTRLPAPDGTPLFWKPDQPTFGVFVTRAHDPADNHVYLWGCLMTGMFLARIEPEAIADLGRYEYLVEAPTLAQPERTPRWSETFASTAPLFDSVPNEMSAAYNPHLRQFVAYHSMQRDNKIVLRTAKEITGPWSEPRVVFRPERKNDTDLIYAVKEHPELTAEAGRKTYITYVNSATYVPHLVEITFQ